MDNSGVGPSGDTAWGPPTAAVVGVGLAGTLMAAGCLLLIDDVPGRILTGTAAVGLLVFAAGSWRARPRLALTPAGLVYRGWLRMRVLQRQDVDAVRITEFRRLGRKVRLLEIDTGDDSLLVLSRWDLGGDPVRVLDALSEAGYAPGQNPGKR